MEFKMEINREINREVYLNRLIVRKHNGFIKVITGIRRCGKSYLLNTLFYKHLLSEGVGESHIIRFAFDTAEDLLKIGEDPIVLDNEKEERKVDPSRFITWLMPQIRGEGMYYLLLDEVQKLGAFESVLNGFLRKQNVDVYVTGSNSKFLSKDILTEFEGRGDEVHVLPLSFSEYYAFKEGDKSEAYDDYSVYGGLPAVVLMNTEEQKTNYLISQMKNVYLRDIVARYSVQDESALGEVIDVIASGISTLTNPRKLENTFQSEKNIKISQLTISTYLDYFIDAFLMEKARRFDVKGKKYISSPYKYYFSDTGLRNARLNFRQNEMTHIMENVIYNELRMRGLNVDVGVVEQNYKNEEGKRARKNLEIDFIVNRGSNKYYIQSALHVDSPEKRAQETASLKQSGDFFRKIVVVKDYILPKHDEDGILYLGVEQFLLDEGAIDL